MPRTPSALLLEGEAGIGKTTLWLRATEDAVAKGFRVLIARGAAIQGFPWTFALVPVAAPTPEEVVRSPIAMLTDDNANSRRHLSPRSDL